MLSVLDGLPRGHFIMSCPLRGDLRGHFIMFYPLEGHPRRNFIMFYLPQGHLRGQVHQGTETNPQISSSNCSGDFGESKAKKKL